MSDLIGENTGAKDALLGPASERRRTAISKSTGQRCGIAPIVGGFVCKWHGGGAPQTKAAARATPGASAEGEAPTSAPAGSGAGTRGDVNGGSPRAIPAVLLARLALDASRPGRGDGSLLLVDGLTTAIDGMRAVGGRLILVDAIDRAAAAFYRKHGFIPCPGRANRLVIKGSDAAVSLGLPWP